MKGRDCRIRSCGAWVLYEVEYLYYFSYTKELLKNTFKIISWMIRFLNLFLGTCSTKWKNLATLLVILCIILSLNLLALGLESPNTQHWCWPENLQFQLYAYLCFSHLSSWLSNLVHIRDSGTILRKKEKEFNIDDIALHIYYFKTL